MAGAVGRLLAVFTLLAMHERVAALSCSIGSTDFRWQETLTNCGADLDACVTFSFTIGKQTGTAYSCSSQLFCQNPLTHKTVLEKILSKAGYIGTVENIVCCIVDNCNRQTSVTNGRTCRFGSSGLGVPEVDKTCAPGEDSCVTAVLSQGGKQLIGRGCATTAQCAAADFKDQLKQYIGTLVSSFTGTVDSFTCCQQNLCNSGSSGGSSGGTGGSSGGSSGGNGCAGLRAAHFTSALLVAATVILSAF